MFEVSLYDGMIHLELLQENQYAAAEYIALNSNQEALSDFNHNLV